MPVTYLFPATYRGPITPFITSRGPPCSFLHSLLPSHCILIMDIIEFLIFFGCVSARFWHDSWQRSRTSSNFRRIRQFVGKGNTQPKNLFRRSKHIDLVSAWNATWKYLTFQWFFRFTHHWELRTSISRSTHQWGEWLEDSRSCDQPDPIRYWIVSEPFIENPGWFRNPQVGSLSSLFPVQLLEGECFVPPHSRVKAGNYRKVTVLECGSIGGTMSKL